MPADVRPRPPLEISLTTLDPIDFYIILEFQTDPSVTMLICDKIAPKQGVFL